MIRAIGRFADAFLMASENSTLDSEKFSFYGKKSVECSRSSDGLKRLLVGLIIGADDVVLKIASDFNQGSRGGGGCDVVRWEGGRRDRVCLD